MESEVGLLIYAKTIKCLMAQFNIIHELSKKYNLDTWHSMEMFYDIISGKHSDNVKNKRKFKNYIRRQRRKARRLRLNRVF